MRLPRLIKPVEIPRIDQLPAIVARLTDRQRLLKGVVIGVIVGMLLGFSVFGGVQQYQKCSSGNDFRRIDRARWEFILVKIGPAHTPVAQKQLDTFKTYIETADALHNCSPF